MVVENANTNIMSNWRYFYRTQICNVADLEQKMKFFSVKCKKAKENNNEEDELKFQKKLNNIRKKYEHASDVLEIIESLEKMRILKKYEIRYYKVLNIRNEEYETKEIIDFTGTGYSFKPSENALYGSFYDLIKDGKIIESH
jgi:hypothetical protein